MIFGMGRYGGAIARSLAARGQRVLGVDFDPEAVRQHRGDSITVVFGDATDPEFVATLPLAGVRRVVLAAPPHSRDVQSDDPRLALIEALRGRGYRGCVAVLAADEADRAAMLAAGADLLLDPFADSAEQAADRITAAHGKETAA